MAERVSALSGHYQRGHFGKEGEAGVTLSEISGLVLHQLSAWPDTLDRVSIKVAQACAVDKAPRETSPPTLKPGRSSPA